MIEVGFSIILGFAITSTLCGLMADGSRGDRILMRGLLYAAILSCLIGLANGGSMGLLGHIQYLVVMSFMEHLLWFALGSALAIAVQLVAEGHAYDLWVRVHPQSAPTPEVQMGQRAKVAGFRF